MEKEGTHEKGEGRHEAGGEGVWGGLRRFGTLFKKKTRTRLCFYSLSRQAIC